MILLFFFYNFEFVFNDPDEGHKLKRVVQRLIRFNTLQVLLELWPPTTNLYNPNEHQSSTQAHTLCH